ncbi:hypothetical protein AAVH_27156 [Aphelenchoides avenae]|nr:hypothetical protein AAVH_27156 [Aphelenchus avenae]
MSSSTIAYAIVFWTQYKVMRKLRFHGLEMPLSVRKMHADVNRALVALAVCPFISALVPLGISIAFLFLRIDIGALSPFMSVFGTSVAACNPITTCLFVRPYRRAIAGLFKKTIDSNRVYAVSFTSGTT